MKHREAAALVYVDQWREEFFHCRGSAPFHSRWCCWLAAARVAPGQSPRRQRHPAARTSATRVRLSTVYLRAVARVQRRTAFKFSTSRVRARLPGGAGAGRARPDGGRSHLTRHSSIAALNCIEVAIDEYTSGALPSILRYLSCAPAACTRVPWRSQVERL